jgi:Tfp pilus assembly protein PilO
MNDQSTAKRLTDRAQLRARIQRLRVTSAGNSMFGMSEILALAGSVFILVIVIISYLYFLVPAKSKLQAATLEHNRLKAALTTSQSVFDGDLSTEATIQKITNSLSRFEEERLIARTPGRMDLYDELNELMRKNGLRNTSGPNYTALEPVKFRSDGTAAKTNTKWQSIYPGIAISLTLEGPYQNLRRFIRDVESSRLFLIVNAVELERATESGGAAGGETGTPRASLVSLRMDMATYFHRVSQPEGEAATPQH